MDSQTDVDRTRDKQPGTLSSPRLGVLLVFLFLWGTFLLRFPVFLVLAFALAAAVFGATLMLRGRMDALALLVLANYGYWLASGLLIGGVVLGDLISPEFYLNDGRGFVYYLPLLFFLVYYAGRDDLQVAFRTVIVLASSSLLLFGVWLVARPAILSVGKADNFGALLTSHTGAGTFFGVLATFLLIFGLVRGRRSLQLLGLATVLPLFASASRQALLSLIVALCWFVMRRANRQARTALAVAMALALLTFPIVSPHAFQRTAAVFSPRTAELARESFQHLSWEPAPGQEVAAVESNILSRFILWTYAVRRFGESPIVGIGFGRYNDYSLGFVGRPGVVYVAVDGERQTNVASAHNTYLHQAAETGFVGLVLLGVLWIAMYHRLAPVEGLPAHHPILAGLTAAQGLIVFTLTSAMFGNALMAPSIGIPVLTLCGVLLSYRRRSERRTAIDPPRSLSLEERPATA